MKSASELVVILGLAAVGVVAAGAGCKAGPHAGGEGTDAGREEPTACARCHTPEFQATRHPPHPDARPTTCGACHTQKSWHRWRVEHPWWELTGAHLRAAEDEKLAGRENQVKCFWCHRGDPATWKDTKKECVSCHEEDAADVKSPADHDTFGTKCESCHTTDTWKHAKGPGRRDAGADHDARDAGPPQHDAGADHDAGGPKPVIVKPVPTPTHTTAPTIVPTTPPTPVPTPTVKPVPTPTTKPTTAPTTTKPDVNTGPSRRRVR